MNPRLLPCEGSALPLSYGPTYAGLFYQTGIGPSIRNREHAACVLSLNACRQGYILVSMQRTGTKIIERGDMKRKAVFCALTALLLVGVLTLLSCSGSAGESGGDADAGNEDGSGNDYSFLVCGDPHGRTDLLAKVVSQAREGEFLVIAGDITTGKGMQEMQMMKDFLDASGLEYHVIPGDNDMPGGDPSVFRAVFGPDYYSLDKQDSHLIFLDDAVIGTGCPDEDLSWLRSDLAGVGEDKLIIAFAHVPPGAPVDIGKSGFVERESKSNREMQDILQGAGALAIYCGHIHAYMPYSSGPPRVVVTGGAGADPHLSEDAGGFHHFLRVTVEGDTVSEEVIRI